MTPQDVLREVQELSSEWLEMSENPAEMTAGILAFKVVTLYEYIEYLEARLEYAEKH